MTRSHPRIPPKISTSITTFEVLTQPVSPPRQYPIAKYSLVSSDCRVDLWMNGFGGFNEFVFCIVMCQVRECYASPEIHLVDVEMLSFDLGPGKAPVREIFDKADCDFVLNALPVGLANRTKEQNPSVTMPAFFFL